MAIKRENGAGSTYQRKDGRWVAQVKDPVSGKRHVRYAPTKNKAEAILREMLQRADQGVPATDSSQTFAQYVEFWLEHRALRKRGESTIYEYKSRLKNHFLPVLGPMKMSRITQVTVEDVLESLRHKGLSKETIRTHRTSLSAVFSDAVRDRVIAFNPVHGAELPQMVKKRSKPIPTSQDVNELVRSIKQLTDERERELGRILTSCVYTGARIGEVLSMRWSDVDMENNIWFLTQTSTRSIDGKTVIGQRTKTGEARKVGLAPELVQAIKAQRKFVAKVRMKSHIWTDNDLVFPSERGTVKDSHNVRKLLQTALPEWEFGFHGIRHWFASLGLQSNVGAVAVARFLGHQSVNTTQDVYGHMLDDGSAKILDAVREAIHE